MQVSSTIWIATNCTEFIGKDEWPPNSSQVNPLDYHIWGVIPSQTTLMH